MDIDTVWRASHAQIQFSACEIFVNTNAFTFIHRLPLFDVITSHLNVKRTIIKCIITIM